MNVPASVTESKLFRRLGTDSELLTALLELRAVTSSLAETVSRTVPTFTDHSIRHMDGLWSVADRVLTEEEIEGLSSAEAFALSSAFYLHDIGMAYAATDEGLRRIRSSPPYSAFMAAAPDGSQRTDLEASAVALAVRTLHAHASEELASQPVPGTDIYLFESSAIRQAWGTTCGRIGASHHWSLDDVERELGAQGMVPLPGGRKGDLAYVASILRLVDYAHINRDRASTVERAFRPSLERGSLIHWLAQENIDGPERDGADLVYRAAKPIDDVDAWWLYYEMLRGLDEEIRTVRRYLDRRAASQGRLTLQGVRGATSPEEAAVYVPTAGFLPIEINLRTGSIERLVQLLAGESLYGPEPMSAVRELIQNARDAVLLKATLAANEFDRAAAKSPIRLGLKTGTSPARLEVTDSGVGMSRKVLTDYLISIASDYWASQFHADFPTARERGFREAGRFGIGFLSVFMLGESVTVESNRDGSERYRLELRGVGRRGELRAVSGAPGSGTAVRVSLREAVAESLKPLERLVRVYAPTLPHPLEVDVDGERTIVEEGWLSKLDAEQFHTWTIQAVGTLLRSASGRTRPEADEELWMLRRFTGHVGDPRTALPRWGVRWPEFTDGQTRLVASPEGMTLLCVRGLAIESIRTPGFVGVIDLEGAVPDVSRSRVVDADVRTVLARATDVVRPQIVENLNELAGDGLLIDQLGFLAQCVVFYGQRTVLEASLPWISFLKLPGETELVSCSTLLRRLTESSSLFVAYGTGPWTAMRKWVGLDPTATRSEPAIVLDDSPYGSVGYVPGSEGKLGRLADLWPSCSNAPLFGCILALAAEAWQVSLDDLTYQEGWRHAGSVIWGRLTRP